MPSFTPPTYNRPFARRGLFRFYDFPVGLIVWIDTDDAVAETATITEDIIRRRAADGSGDFGKAIFRRGKTYTVTAGEESLLTGAGYTVE